MPTLNTEPGVEVTLPGSVEVSPPGTTTTSNSGLFFLRGLSEISLTDAEVLVFEKTIAAVVLERLDQSYQTVKSVKITSTTDNGNGGLSVSYDLTIEEKCKDPSCTNQQVDVAAYAAFVNDSIQTQITNGKFETILKESVSQLCCEVGCCGDTFNNSAFVFLPIDASDVVVVIVTVSPTSRPTNNPTTAKPTKGTAIKPTKKPTTKSTNTNKPMIPTNKQPTAKPTAAAKPASSKKPTNKKQW